MKKKVQPITIKNINLGWSHSAALSSNGQVFTWGFNKSGQLGDGTEINKNIPIDITQNFKLKKGEKIFSLNLGSVNSSAITSTGRVFMWGSNSFGQLGDGTEINKNIPIDITQNFKLKKDEKIISLSLGCNHSSALSSTGRVFMWGSNVNGTLGIGIISNKFNVINLPEFDDFIIEEALNTHNKILGTKYYSNVPIDITQNFKLKKDEKIISLSLGFFHSSALSSTGRVFMWGSNSCGELGDGTEIGKNLPIDITQNFSLETNDKIVYLSLGGYHSSALSNIGSVFLWGNNEDGQLGDRTNTNRYYPTEITSSFINKKYSLSPLSNGDKIISLSLGGYHSSALSNFGFMYFWGDNENGQLGGGIGFAKVNNPLRSRTGSFESIKTVVLGYDHSSALTTNGEMLIWGCNQSGQLGDSTKLSRNFSEVVNFKNLLKF